MQKLIKWFGYGAVALVGLFLIAVGYVYWKSEAILNKTMDLAPITLDLPPADSAAVARGRHIALAYGCRDCHGPDLAGLPTIDAMPLAYIPASNLTPAGAGAYYSDGDWLRAIRHGIGPDGKSLWLMPSAAFTRLSPADLAALIAFLKQVEPVRRDLPQKRFGPYGRLLLVRGGFTLAADRVNHSVPFRAAPPAGPTRAYGDYLAHMCRSCHGQNLAGGRSEFPAAGVITANLTPGEDGIAHYSEADFVRALREGVKPSGAQMESIHMPWQATAALTDTEIRAIWVYLQDLKPERTIIR